MASVLIPGLDHVWLRESDDFVSDFFVGHEGLLKVEGAHQINSASVKSREYSYFEGRGKQSQSVVVHAIRNLPLESTTTVENLDVGLLQFESFKNIKGSEIKYVVLVFIIHRLLMCHVDFLHLSIKVSESWL